MTGMRQSRTVIVIPCSFEKRPGGIRGLWSPHTSIISELSREDGAHLLELRQHLAMHYGYSEGDDLGTARRGESPPLMPACDRYAGHLYKKVDPKTWARLKRAPYARVVIVSALYGLLSPQEAIRAYNRTMRGGYAPRMTLGRWWSERGLGTLLAEYVERIRATVVHDFLSGTYAKVAETLDSLGHRIEVRRHDYCGLGSGADYHRGQDVQAVLSRLCCD